MLASGSSVDADLFQTPLTAPPVRPLPMGHHSHGLGHGHSHTHSAAHSSLLGRGPSLGASPSRSLGPGLSQPSLGSLSAASGFTTESHASAKFPDKKKGTQRTGGPAW